MNRQLSDLRSQLRQSQQELQTLLEAFLGRESLLPGSVYILRRKCGKKNCRCARGELHESTVLSYRGQGRTQNVSPPPEQIPTLRKLTGDYRHCRQARAQLVRLQQQMLKVVDALEAARVQQGEAQFRKLRAPSSPVRKPRSER
jgi:hypothetical protein